MKQAAMLVIMLSLATFLYAQQQTPATQNQPAGKPPSRLSRKGNVRRKPRLSQNLTRTKPLRRTPAIQQP